MYEVTVLDTIAGQRFRKYYRLTGLPDNPSMGDMESKLNILSVPGEVETYHYVGPLSFIKAEPA